MELLTNSLHRIRQHRMGYQSGRLELPWMTSIPYYVTQVSDTPIGQRQLLIPSILAISYHLDATQTRFPPKRFRESDKVLRIFEFSGPNVGPRFLWHREYRNSTHVAPNVDYLDMQQEGGIIRSRTLRLVGSLSLVMSFLKRGNQGVRQRVWGSKYHCLKQTYHRLHPLIPDLFLSSMPSMINQTLPILDQINNQVVIPVEPRQST
jgi:hypothetical protein